MVSAALAVGLQDDRDEPGAVVGDDRTALGLRTLEELRVRQAPQVESLADRDGVRAPVPELSLATAAGIISSRSSLTR